MDLKLPTTAAQLYLADYEEMLLLAVVRERTRLQELAANRPKGSLVDTFPNEGIVKTPAASASKADWAAAWVEANLRQSTEQSALNEARRKAAYDTQADNAVKALVTKAEKLVADFLDKIDPADPTAINTLVYRISWKASELAAAQVARELAMLWLARRAKGHDIRTISAEAAQSALRRHLLTSSNGGNLQVNGRGVVEAAQGAGVQRFLRAIATVLPDELQYW